MAQTTYTVVKGDTLTSIASKYGTTVNELVRLNGLADPNYIVIGQVLVVAGEADEKKVVVGEPTIDTFGLLSGTTRNLYASWPSWQRSETESYKVRWFYDTGDAIGWIVGEDGSVNVRQSLYSGAPENALRVRFVMCPVAKADEDGTVPWTSPWSKEKIYVFADNPPKAPATPSEVTIDGNCRMTITIDNLDVGNASLIEFQIVKVARNEDETTYVFHTGKADINIVDNSVTYSCKVAAGSLYKVRCRSVRGTITSDWSAFSTTVGSVPTTPSQITTCKAKTATSVYLEWTSVDSADSYDIQYATDESYFDNSNKVTTESDVKFNHYELTGLESGIKYFFRVRAKNEKAGESGWSPVASTAIGAKPTSPTTWSSKSTAIIGELVTLYWAHNVEDGSDQNGYMIEIGMGKYSKTHYSTDETAANEFFEIDTSDLTRYVPGAIDNQDTVITWKVKTKSISGEYCDEWSVTRTINVYVQPTISLMVADSESNPIEKLETFPFYILGTTAPATQNPIGYHVSIISNMAYDTFDNLGNEIYVKEGDLVYSEYFDTSEQLSVEISANNITLENNIRYTISVVASMDSGLTAEATYGSFGEFYVAWTSEQYVPNAQINIDKTSLTASIRPYCEKSDGTVVTDAYMSVYRRDYDGRFTEVATDLDCDKYVFVTDPHPALDYARYRIVAKTKSTGAISYYDIPGIAVGEKAAVIQWDEQWSSFESMTEKDSTQPPWSGSLLKLPYNVDVSDKYNIDVSHVEYIGREHPVSYHGTQTGESSTWNADIDKNDKETLHLIRRLSIWRGNVYAREPSGSGYWATVTVSYGIKHKELTIPVTINLTRVEGGV